MIARVGAKIAPEKVEMQREISAGDQHEQDNDTFYVDTVEGRDTTIASGKTAGGHSAEGVAQGIEKVHSPCQQEQRLRR